MKKHFVVILSAAIAFGACACGETAEPEQKPTSEEQVDLSEDERIKQFVQDTVADNYRSTTVDSITINENLGTDTADDYIVLVNLTWDVKNSAKTTKEMLEMYTSDLAANLNQTFDSVSEITVFWAVPYHTSDGKISYEKVDNGMKLADKIFNF